MVFSTRSYPLQIVGGVAKFLADLDLGAWDEFGEGAPYVAGTRWRIVLGPDMPVTPDEVIVITPGVQSFMRADVVSGVQIRIRGRADTKLRTYRDEVADKAQAIHDAFYPNGFPRVHFDMGGIRVGAVFPGDALPLDPDGNRRWGNLQNFRIRSRRPRPEQ